MVYRHDGRGSCNGQQAHIRHESIPKLVAKQSKRNELVDQVKKKHFADLLKTIEKYQKLKENTSKGKTLSKEDLNFYKKLESNGSNYKPTWQKQLNSFKSQIPNVECRGSKSNRNEIKSNNNINEKVIYKDPDKLSKVKVSLPYSEKGNVALNVIENLKTKIKVAESSPSYSAINSASGNKSIPSDVLKVSEVYVNQLQKTENIDSQDVRSTKNTNVLNYLTESLRETGVEIFGDVQSDLEIISDQVKEVTVDQDLYQSTRFTQRTDHVKEVRELISEAIQQAYGAGFKKMAINRALEKLSKEPEKRYNKDLCSYIEVCMNSGMTKEAHTLVTSIYLLHKNQTKKRPDLLKITNISVYNQIIWAWAKQGDISKIMKLFGQLELFSLKPTLETYAACFFCLGTYKHPHQQLVGRILKDMETQGLDLSELLSQCSLSAEDQHCINQAIKCVKPDYTANVGVKETGYQCDLLKDLHPNFEQENPFHGVMSSDMLSERVDKQMRMEEEDAIMINSINRPVPVTPVVKLARDKLKCCKEHWKQSIHQAFTWHLKLLEKKMHGECKMSILPYLKLFPADVYVAIMLEELDMLVQDMAKFSQELAGLEISLGTKIYNKYLIKKKQRHGHWEKASGLYKLFIDEFNRPRLKRNHREMWTDILSKHDGEDMLTDKTVKWSTHTRKKIGAFLYAIILADVKIDPQISRITDSRQMVPSIPAFYILAKNREKKYKVLEIQPHPVLVNLFNKAAIHQLKMYPLVLPSLAPPVPWCNVTYGVDVAGRTDLIKDTNYTREDQPNQPKSPSYPVLDAINTVSMTPWKINKPILDILLHVFNSGGDLNLSIPKPPSSFPELQSITSDMTLEQKVKVFLERNKCRQEQSDMYSRWCTELKRFSIANQYRDEIFWFSHNLDFRGRVYACATHFNHIGSDISRCMLMFAKGKPLGPDGLNWLKIHLVNLSGLKKRSSNKERLAFANECMDDIFDSADNPLMGRQWWKKCDEPWQSLACCMEIAKATRSPDPEKYICHLPVHQDGSCNGLQHYAALGRDHAGAVSVNLTPRDIPSDVYADVVELVEKERVIDAAKGNAVALALQGFVKRKVIKQTIMTTVYGVTFYGAKKQILNQLEDLEDFPQEYIIPASIYLTEKTFHCLQQKFTSTKQIQDWLVVCADLISNLYHPVKWETPLGLSVIQNYYSTSQQKLPRKKSRLQKVMIEKPNTRKQRNAFPPNFIHSLDATHMMLTAIHCLRVGITFVSVHDCYWTHPCDVHIMNKICREQFVALHQQPILENLSAGMLAQYGFNKSDMRDNSEKEIQAKNFLNAILQQIPERGTFELEKVLDSTYFFS